MKYLVSTFIIIAVACNSGYDTKAESEHVNNLNRERLNGMLKDMMKRVRNYNFINDPELDFVGLMKIHHLTAIQMCKREMEWGNNKELKTFAKQVITAENIEVDRFEEYEHLHKPTSFNHSFFNEAEKLLASEQEANEQGNIDHVFRSLIIRHHQSAIQISNLYLKYGADPQIGMAAQEMIEHHKKNILELQRINL